MQPSEKSPEEGQGSPCGPAGCAGRGPRMTPLHELPCPKPECGQRFDEVGPVMRCRAGHRWAAEDVTLAASKALQEAHPASKPHQDDRQPERRNGLTPVLGPSSSPLAKGDDDGPNDRDRGR